MEFVSKLCIPYQNGGLIAICVNGVMVIVKDGIRPLPQLEGVDTTVVQTAEGGLGGRIPPMVVSKRGV
jgi:hypothetical protein